MQPHLLGECAQEGVPKSLKRGERTHQRVLVSRGFESPQTRLLPQVDLGRIDSPAREEEHDRLATLNDLADLLHRPGFCNARGRPQLRPEHPDHHVALTHQLLIDDFLWTGPCCRDAVSLPPDRQEDDVLRLGMERIPLADRSRRDLPFFRHVRRRRDQDQEGCCVERHALSAV